MYLSNTISEETVISVRKVGCFLPNIYIYYFIVNKWVEKRPFFIFYLFLNCIASIKYKNSGQKNDFFLEFDVGMIRSRHSMGLSF